MSGTIKKESPDAAEHVSTGSLSRAYRTVVLSRSDAEALGDECDKARAGRDTNTMNISLIRQGCWSLLPNANLAIMWRLSPEGLDIFSKDVLEKVKAELTQSKRGHIVLALTPGEVDVLEQCGWECTQPKRFESAHWSCVRYHPFRAFPLRRISRLSKTLTSGDG